MRRKLQVVGAIGSITRLFSFAFLLPAVVSLGYDPYDLALGPLRLPRLFLIFLFCFAGSYLLGTAMRAVPSSLGNAEIRDREAYLTVGLGWLVLCLLSMMPFLMSRTFTSPVDAFFEAMSGLTTTGATALPGALEQYADSIHIWRAFLQFIGGMGIIVLSVAILAKLAQGGRQMIQAEAPGPSVTSLAPRLAQTARILWTVYLVAAATVFVLLFVAIWQHDLGFKQTLYEALLHAFTTIATGGFSSHTTSIAYFDDVFIEVIIIVFVLVSGTNYSLTYHLIRGKPGRLWRDPEWRFFMTTFVLVTLAISGTLARMGNGIGPSLRAASFTTASLITSTGYATADFDQFSSGAKILLLLIMVTGGTAGSTSGGMKHVRILLIGKLVLRELKRVRHPNAALPVRLGGRIVEPATLLAVVAFFLTFIALWAAGTVALVALDPIFSSPVDAASATVAALSNMGPGLGVVGPAQNYAGLAWTSKIILSFLMWFGRLEIFAALLVFMPGTWRN